ncbi:MAG: hypothetical protein FWG51_05700, partial [Firmicutes bacterium]|nr:hypothetical protein [Bacillota bacterium]
MKRNLLKVIAAAVLTAALLVLAACGGYNSDYLPIKEQGGISLKNVSEINLASNEIVTEHVAAHNTVIIRNNETTPNTYCLYDLTKKAYVGEKNYTSLSASSGN